MYYIWHYVPYMALCTIYGTSRASAFEPAPGNSQRPRDGGWGPEYAGQLAQHAVYATADSAADADV